MRPYGQRPFSASIRSMAMNLREVASREEVPSG
jgi:hypothetical protein